MSPSSGRRASGRFTENCHQRGGLNPAISRTGGASLDSALRKHRDQVRRTRRQISLRAIWIPHAIKAPGLDLNSHPPMEEAIPCKLCGSSPPLGDGRTPRIAVLRKHPMQESPHWPTRRRSVTTVNLRRNGIFPVYKKVADRTTDQWAKQGQQRSLGVLLGVHSQRHQHTIQ